MADPKEAPANTAALEQELQTARAERDTAKAAMTTAKSEGASAERARIKAILQADAAKERPTLAQHMAFDTDMTVDAASAMLAKAALETPGKPVNPLDAAMRGTNPKVGAGAEVTADAQPITIDTSNIYAMRRKASGRA